MKFTLVIYIVLTAALYNGFFPVDGSSRIPFLLFGYFLGPLILARIFVDDFRVSANVFSLPGFLLGFLSLELVHLMLGSNELLAITGIVGLLMYLRVAKRYNTKFFTDTIEVSCLAYLIIFYPLAYLNGMVGLPRITGSFVAQYLPFISDWVVNGNYPSGRGVIGLMGAILALLAGIKLKLDGGGLIRLLTIGLGVAFVFLSDTRGVIIAFLILASILIVPLTAIQRAKILVMLPIGILIIQPLVIAGIDELVRADVVDLFARQGIELYESRSVVWSNSSQLITASPIRAAIGYGETGSSEALRRSFSTFYEYEKLDSTHNLTLQLLLDGGLLLLFLFLGFTARVCYRACREIEYWASEGLGSFMVFDFLLIYGSSASVIAFDRINEAMFLFFVSLVGITKGPRVETAINCDYEQRVKDYA